METRRWTNPSQPQTLQIAVFLLYANAVMSLLLFDRFIIRYWNDGLAFLAIVGFAIGGFGVANEKRWGYNVALATAFAEALTFGWIMFRYDAWGDFVISAMFSIALVALLMHPQSRQYQKIWFS